MVRVRIRVGRGTCPPPTFTNGWAWRGGGTVRRKTANKKLTKLYWPSQKRSPKRLIVLLEPDWCPPLWLQIGDPTHFQICSGTTGFRVRNMVSRSCDTKWSNKEGALKTHACTTSAKIELTVETNVTVPHNRRTNSNHTRKPSKSRFLLSVTYSSVI